MVTSEPCEGRRGDGRERRRRQVAGHAQVARLQPLAAAHRDGAAVNRGRHAERLERALGVIAGGRRLGDAGRALGVQAGQQHGALHLGARHLGLIVDGVQRAAVDHDRAAGRPRRPRTGRPSASSGAITRRIGRRVSEASPNSVVAKGWAARTPASIRMVRPGIATVEPGRGRDKPAAGPGPRSSPGPSSGAAGACDTPRAARQASVDCTVGAGRVVGERGDAVGQGGQNRVAMRDRLVAGNSDSASHGAGGSNHERHAVHYSNLTGFPALWY